MRHFWNVLRAAFVLFLLFALCSGFASKAEAQTPLATFKVGDLVVFLKAGYGNPWCGTWHEDTAEFWNPGWSATYCQETNYTDKVGMVTTDPAIKKATYEKKTYAVLWTAYYNSDTKTVTVQTSGGCWVDTSVGLRLATNSDWSFVETGTPWWLKPRPTSEPFDPNKTALLPPECSATGRVRGTIIVQPGDWPQKIADNLGVTLEELAHVNKKCAPRLLEGYVRAGQKLWIPDY